MSEEDIPNLDNIYFNSVSHETINVERLKLGSKKDSDKDGYNLIINGPGNCISLIILLLLDQLHDFFEHARGKDAVKQYSEKEANTLINIMVEKTKNFIENFEYTRSSDEPYYMTDFKTFLNGNEPFKKFYEKIFTKNNKGEYPWLKGNKKYDTARSLLKLIDINYINFEKLEKTFSDENDHYYSSSSCNNLKNLFYYYLLYSGYIESDQIVNHIKLTVDATKNPYNISPLLYNICDFIFSNDYNFEKVNLVKSVATEYDAAGTQSPEIFVNKLEKKKSQRLVQMNIILKKLEDSLESEEEELRRRRKVIKDTDLQKTNELRYKIYNIKREIEDLKNKDIETKSSKELMNNNNSILRKYVISYGKKRIIDYSLTMKKYSLKLNLSPNTNIIIENIKKFDIKKRKILLGKLLDNLLIKLGYTSEQFNGIKNSEKITLINSELPSKDEVKFKLYFIETVKYEEYIEYRWQNFLSEKNNKTKVKKLGKKYPYSTIFNSSEKENEKIHKELKESFIKKIEPKKPDKNDKFVTIKNDFQKRINEFKNFLNVAFKMGIMEVSINSNIVIPKFKKWFDYDIGKMLIATNNLIIEEDSDGNFDYNENYLKSGMSQPHIVKTINTSNVKLEDNIYYYPFKTIGDLSQIQECSYDSLSPGKKDFVHIFITFDRICGYISSLFNRTIVEEQDKDETSLFKLNTFTYPKNIFKMENFNKYYRDITSGIYKSFSDIPDEYESLQSKNKKQMIESFIAYQELEDANMLLDLFPIENKNGNNVIVDQEILPLTN